MHVAGFPLRYKPAANAGARNFGKLKLTSWAPQDYRQVLEKVSNKSIREWRQRLDNLIKADATFEAHKVAAEKLVHLIAEGFPDYTEKELFRGRLWRNANALPKRSEELLAPPSNIVTEYGRLNQPGESLFYAAETTHTIVKELGAQPGDEIAFVRLSGIESAEKLRLSRLGVFPAAGGGHTESLDEVLPLYRFITGSESNLRKVNTIRQYISQLLSDRRPRLKGKSYKATAAIASVIFSMPDVKGIIYPSVEVGDTACNMALRPEVIGQEFRPDHVAYIEIVDVEKYHHRAKVLYTGWVDPQGNLIWDNSVAFDFPLLLRNRAV